MTVDPSWHLAVALVALLGVAVAWSVLGRLQLGRSMVWAAVRAVLQLAVVSLIIVVALTHVLAALAFAALMFVVAVWTTAGRVEARRSIGWVALAMLVGVVPVMAVIFASGVMPFTGVAIVPIFGIIIGNAMNGHTLICRRAFATLREEHGLYEAGLAIGLVRSEAIGEMIGRRTRESLLPNLDTTRTVGLVTLPGAFV
ncbi:MAG: ABC transporter permease, partial [Propionibacterium sp.]|nr:ABC transporter permease [Propionibacterium sp.]